MRLFTKTCRQSLAVITILALIGVCPAFGQNEDDSYLLEDIIVTADKRSENIQKVPVAITAFGETELEDSGAEDIIDVIDMIPGLNLEGWTSNWYSVTYRGIGLSTFTDKNPVVIYVDGIPLDSRIDFNSDLLNIERVEFLRGPQGTLYGKNAIGGVINVISKKPGNIVEGRIRGKYAENGTYGLIGNVNSPLIKDKLFVGLSAQYYESDGFMTNDDPGEDTFDYEKTKNVKTQLRWMATEQLEINFQGGFREERNGAGSMISSTDEVIYHAYKNPDNRANLDAFYSALNIDYSAGFAEFISTTTYRDSNSDFWEYTSDATSGRFADQDISTFTQEVRLQSLEQDSGFKWVTGLYYSAANTMAHGYGNTYDMTDSLGYLMKMDWPYDQDEKTSAVFGQTTVPIYKPVDFTAGLRYERTEKSMDYTGTTIRQDTNQELSRMEWQDEHDWDAFLPKGVISWTATPDAMLYFSAAQGYLAGGFNRCDNNKTTARFDEETSINYEFGTKTSWLSNRLFLNTTLFYVDIRDMHVYSSPSPGIYVATNAAEAHSQGIELEAKVRPFEGMDINASFAWTDAEFDDYNSYTGNTPTHTPDYSLFLSAQYRHETGFYVRGGMKAYGKTYYDEANTIKRDPLELFNGKLGYEMDNWDIYAYVNNLTNEEYFSEMSSHSMIVGEPRMVGITASFHL